MNKASVSHLLFLIVFTLSSTIHMENLHIFSLPFQVQLSIVSLVGISDFQCLGPLIASGKQGARLAFDQRVLKTTSLHMLETFPHLAATGSKFQPFIGRCASAGNNAALYLESVRLFGCEGEVDKAIEILDLKYADNILLKINLIGAIFHYCDGSVNYGTGKMVRFLQASPSPEHTRCLVEKVVYDICTMSTTNMLKKRYIAKVLKRYIPTSYRPFCYRCTPDDRCPKCLLQWCCFKLWKKFYW